VSIERLEAIIPPPARPEEVPDAAVWETVERNVAALPADYREFVSRYGTGWIDSFIWIFNPASRNPNLNLERQVQKQLQVLEEVNQGGMEFVIPLFPQVGGVLPFGITDNGDLLVWKTDGDTKNWTVGVLGARSSPLLIFAMDMTSFLAGVCGGSIACAVFPQDFPSQNPAFSSGF
jgi:hypothetical protein